MYKESPMYVDIHTDTRRKTPYSYGLFRESYRDDAGRVCHRTRGKITGLPVEKLQALRDFFRAGLPEASTVEKEVLGSRESGASRAVWELARALGLERMLYSRREPWVRYALAMIVGRVVWQGSKLSLVNLWPETVLWELAGLGSERPDVNRCYAAMDELLTRQGAIEKKLAADRLSEGCVVLYDLTRVYMEGAYEDSGLVDFGYSSCGPRGHKQILVALMTDKGGCPVGVKVYRGNTADQTTVADRVAQLKRDYGLSEVIFVADRGTLTASRIKDVGEAGLKTVTALRHGQIVGLLDRQVIQMGLFDERNIAEVTEPENPAVRYLLCKNPETADKETTTRRALLDKTAAALTQLQARKRPLPDAELAAKVGELLGKWKMKKFFLWEIRAGKLEWRIDTDRVAKEEALDGCYVVRTDVSKDAFVKQEAVACYRQLTWVEQAFRNLKTVFLEFRPVFHRKDERIEAHALICMLAYYLEWHLIRRLEPLFAADGEGEHRRWTLDGVLERLKSLRREILRVEGVTCEIQTTPDDEQQKILNLLAGKEGPPLIENKM
jgi:transposase